MESVITNKAPVNPNDSPHEFQGPSNRFPFRLMDLNEVKDLLGLSTSTIRLLETSGDFPARRKISKQRIAWISTEIEEWILNRPKVKGAILD